MSSAFVSNNSSYNNVMIEIDDYSSEIKEEKGINRAWYGLHYAGQDKIYDGKIHEISLGYRVDKAMKFEEARSYFYEVADGLLNRINNNEKIKTYFYHYPVGYEDLHFCLAFDYESKGHLKRDDVDSIHIKWNEIFYEIVEKEGPSQPILESQGAGLFMLKGYTGKNRSIIRKLPESLDLNEKEKY
jgi:hypothetical protein